MKQKSCLEYLSLCRARHVISSIFPTRIDVQDGLYRGVLRHALFWHELPDPIPASKWAQLIPGMGRGGGGAAPAQNQVDERCVALLDFLDVVLAQFRAMELEIRHGRGGESR